MVIILTLLDLLLLVFLSSENYSVRSFSSDMVDHRR